LELIASLWSLFALALVFIYLFIYANLGATGAEELIQKIEYDYGDYNDYSLTGVHVHPILNTY
jgi:hypothetical protein